MKNWLRFKYGSWINGKTWQEEGIVYVDPAAVTAVQSFSNRFPDATGSIIRTSTDDFSVYESPEQILTLIQSALP